MCSAGSGPLAASRRCRSGSRRAQAQTSQSSAPAARPGSLTTLRSDRPSCSNLLRCSDLIGTTPGPGHELVEARGGPEIDELGEHISEVGLRIDVAQFAGLDKRSNAGPVLGALIGTGEE